MNKHLLTFFGLIIFAAITKLFIFSADETTGNKEYHQLFTSKYSIFALTLPEDLNFSNEKVPLEDSDIRERLDRELLSNTYFQSNTLLLHKRANKLFPVIESILKKNNIPDDFKYLAIAESNLTNSVSPLGATGIWQLMEATAKSYGLEINDEVDERYQLESATLTACKYLKDAYRVFGNWTLAAASYNMGIDGIKNQIEKQKQSNYYDLSLNEETSRYIFRVLAIKEIVSQPVKYGFHFRKKDLYHPVPTYSLPVDSSISDLAGFALTNNINYKIIKIFNPWLRKNTLTVKDNKKYNLTLPKEGYYTFGIVAEDTMNINNTTIAPASINE